MPHVINGIGTWYWGRRNQLKQSGICEACGKHGELSSYDTSLYFVVLFIPIIPLGKKRILSECPSCRRHRVVKLREWQKAREHDIAAAVKALHDNPNNPEAAASTIRSLVLYQDLENFKLAAPLIRQCASGHFEVLWLLGASYEEFSFEKEAEEAYRAALALKDEPDARKSLARVLIQRQRPAEARPLLQYILDGKIREQVGMLYYLMAGYQVMGLHQDALDLADAALGAFPDLEKDKEFKTFRKISQKNLRKGKRIKSPLFGKSKQASFSEGGAWRTWIPKVIGPAVALLLIAWYLSSAVSAAKSRTVYVVNGLDRPYSVEINGKKRKLPATGRTAVELPEGPVRVKGVDPEVPIPEQQCRIETPFWSRPFVSPTLVLNPDKVAVIVWEQIMYSDAPVNDTEGSQRIYAGELYYHFSGIDYPFGTFPEQISSESKKVRKERIYLLKDFSFLEKVSIIEEYTGEKAAVNYLRDLAYYHPGDNVLLRIAVHNMELKDALEFLQPRLSQRPMLVNWHRVYQDLVKQADPKHDLAGEYRALFDKEKDSKDLAYLLGRVVSDPAESDELFKQAAEEPNPCIFALYALGWQSLRQGKFEEALGHFHKARLADPKELEFQAAEQMALLALNRHDEFLELNRKGAEGSDVDPEELVSELLVLIQRGDEARARESVKLFFSEAQEKVSKETQKVLEDYFEASIRYGKGDLAGYGELLSPMELPEWKFFGLLSSGKLQEASETLKGIEDATPYHHFLLFLEGARNNQNELADKHYDLALEVFGKGDEDEQKIARILESGQPPAVEEIARLPIAVSDECILLASVGTKFPDQKQGYFDLARRLNFNTRFPHLLIKEIVD